jgi:hypothetical protein
MQVPSGKFYDEGDLDLLRKMAEVGFVKYSDKPFPLKSRQSCPTSMCLGGKT